MSTVRLILADDNAALRKDIAQELAAYEDIEVVGEAPDGLAALEVCAETEADVLLLDVIMPRMDGLSVLAELQKREKAPRVLVFTAVGNDGVIARHGTGRQLLHDQAHPDPASAPAHPRGRRPASRRGTARPRARPRFRR